MVTSETVVPVRRQRRFLRRIAFLVVLVLAVAAVGAALFYAGARAALPKLDGQIAVDGLHAPVTVIRDARGVPNISAASLTDLFFAQGYITAQDRLWQMDMTRRYAAGELAEVLGPKYVAHDRTQRILLIREAAANAAAQLTPRDREYFEAYARGVNTFIRSQWNLPIEFRVLHYKPRPWTVTDSFLVAASMVQMLNLNTISHELERERLSARLSPELAADLFPNSSWRDHPPDNTPGADEFLPEEPSASQPAAKQDAPEPRPTERPRRRAPAPRRRHRRLHSTRHRTSQEFPELKLAAIGIGANAAALVPGSNNWVISGAHTVSGKPLLANDMHLPHRIPNVWYEAHLTSGNYDVAGVTLPGIPYVIVGHNRRIAWGFTNIGPAVTDLYVETFNQSGQYLTPDGWRDPEHRRETIVVRGGRNQTIDVTITRHGPIVSDAELPRGFGQSAAPLDPTRRLALRWTLYDPAALQVPFFDMNMAQNWAEFRQALSRFGSPAQNVVYADVDGHIGYQAAGVIPIRASASLPPPEAGAADTRNGAFPVSGSDNAHEWTGYIPFDQLPSVFDPPSGIIATANGRITPDGYPYTVSNEWGAPYRTERIYHMLQFGKQFSPADMLQLQTDVYSDFDRFCAERFVYAIDHAATASKRAREAAELMRNWDGQETVSSAAAAITAAAREELVRLLLAPKLGDQWKDYRWFMEPVWLESLLLHQPARWLPSSGTSWDDLLVKAVENALKQSNTPADLNTWRWGENQPVQVKHPIFGSIPLLRRWAETGKAEQSGNAYTVKQVGSHFGPSERLTVDLSNLDASTLNIVNGQSGQIFSPYFNDQWNAWLEGSTFPLPFSTAAVEQARAHQLVLMPK